MGKEENESKVQKKDKKKVKKDRERDKMQEKNHKHNYIKKTSTCKLCGCTFFMLPPTIHYQICFKGLQISLQVSMKTTF